MKTHTRSSEAGSAYVITLLALVVLTILALSLALVTQTEVQVGANEKTVNRTFYAADSGLGIAVAEAPGEPRLRRQDGDPEQGVGGGGELLSTNVADRVTISPAVQINQYPCNWCPQNQGGQQFFGHHLRDDVDRAAGQLERQRRSARRRHGARAEDPARHVRVRSPGAADRTRSPTDPAELAKVGW